MALIHPADLLQHAYRHRYAVATLRVANLEFLRGILAAAEELRAPVMLGFSAAEQGDEELEVLLAAARSAAAMATVPVTLHLESARNREDLVRGIALGCQSVGLDASDLAFPENRALTRHMMEIARDCGIHLEGTLGQSAAPENGKGKILQVTAAEARAYAEATDVGCLALHIEARDRRLPVTDIQRLARINQAVGRPLAINADQGLREDQFARAIANGVARIACAGSLQDAALVSVLDWAEKPTGIEFMRLRRSLEQGVHREAARLILLCGGAGRAAEVMAQCRPWREVEHVILFNSSADAEDAESVIAAGRKILAPIPGVRQVRVGRSLTPGAPYRHAWLIRFAAGAVIDAYARHPDHVAYADGQFRPIAVDRLKIDYEIR